MRILSRNKLLNSFILITCAGFVLLWIALSVLLINKVSFSVVTFITQNEVHYPNNTFNLKDNNIYHGKFKANDGKLGMIITELKSRQIKKNTSGRIIFKLKNESSSKWIFEKSYDIRLFDSQKSFSFGFPIILNSRNKDYTFDIYLENPYRDNFLEISNPNNFVTGYKYERSQIMANKSTLLHFIISKTVGSFSDINFITRSFIFLSPLIVFLFLLSSIITIIRTNKKLPISKNIKFFKPYLKYIILFLVFAELSFPQIFQLPSSYILILLWFFALFVFKFKSNISFIISLLLIIVWIIIIPFNLNSLESNLNVLVYFSFATGVVQLLIEQGKQK